MGHPNLVEVHCHAGVIRIMLRAFFRCPSLRRVIIPGVTTVDCFAFEGCPNLVVVKCHKLERIRLEAFSGCESLSNINLLSVKIVEAGAFKGCKAMPRVTFSKDLESLEGNRRDHRQAFVGCTSLESITIPLKNGLITGSDTFIGCKNLKRVKLVDDEVLRDFADALLLESWRSDLKDVIGSINQDLANADPGRRLFSEYLDDIRGGKANAVRDWIKNVLSKVIRYRAAHNELLEEATAGLQLFLPGDMVMNNVRPFIELPAHKFHGEGDIPRDDSIIIID